ncbi:MAG TPA: UDP-N-acetylenolpyruvoylglucosamine reductase [Chloroflexi bacterium]|nr:UDP-N-acetylenolpyruvoylglucosamine reductase [Chloroflexota bacterium]
MSGRTRAASVPPIEVSERDATIKIQPQARTDLYNTFRVGGPADYLVRAGTADEIGLALRWAGEHGLPVTIFGGGSNQLVSDRGIRGLVVLVRRPGKDAEAGLEVLEEDDKSVLVRVPASAPSSWFGRTAAERGWAGLAWLVGLPGNVGGAVVNNAGAHGGEISDFLVSVRVVGEDGVLVEHDRDWLQPRYRGTRLKYPAHRETIVVVDATFRFAKRSAVELLAEADEYAEYRHRTQPTGACAGSIFKNPDGDYSGRLIEQAGLKGARVGGATVSTMHANFIVNDEKGTAADIIELIRLVQDEVERQTGIRLEPEVERTGDWS